MDHYRVNKLAEPSGAIVKRRDILANSDAQAIEIARHDPDCPICEVRRAAKVVGKVE
ncbi:MAG TPA: hypothetical protein VF628_05740 [Allosphingosinicella sp.]|jgi:hypothetical protein